MGRREPRYAKVPGTPASREDVGKPRKAAGVCRTNRQSGTRFGISQALQCSRSYETLKGTQLSQKLSIWNLKDARDLTWLLWHCPRWYLYTMFTNSICLSTSSIEILFCRILWNVVLIFLNSVTFFLIYLPRVVPPQGATTVLPQKVQAVFENCLPASRYSSGGRDTRYRTITQLRRSEGTHFLCFLWQTIAIKCAYLGPFQGYLCAVSFIKKHRPFALEA